MYVIANTTKDKVQEFQDGVQNVNNIQDQINTISLSVSDAADGSLSLVQDSEEYFSDMKGYVTNTYNGIQSIQNLYTAQ